MSLDQSINHNKEHRKQYYGAKSIDKTCRNHGSDEWSKSDRMIHNLKDDIKMAFNLKEYKKSQE